MSEGKRQGRKSIPVWIDGERYESTSLAREKLKVTSIRYREFQAALRGLTLFDGHEVSSAAPAPRPLLCKSCTHRLGVYRGSRV